MKDWTRLQDSNILESTFAEVRPEDKDQPKPYPPATAPPGSLLVPSAGRRSQDGSADFIALQLWPLWFARWLRMCV